LGNVVSVAAGNYHSVALKGDGTLVAWGDNNLGQTTAPAGLAGVIGIAAGGAHTVALTSAGTVVAWGYNGSGQATPPSGLTNVVSIVAGAYHTAAVKADGTIIAWGWTGYGQTAVPAGLSSIGGVGAGGAHTLAQKADATVVAWGDNTLGQALVSAGLTGVFRIAAGGEFSLALRDARILPAIATQPVSQSVLSGQPVTFSTVATGTPAPTFQWRLGGIALAGATNASYTITATLVADAGSYDVVATNSAGGISSAIATLTVGKVAPTIAWATPGAIVYGVALSATQLNATASVPGTFAYNPIVGTVLGAAAAQTLEVTFTPNDIANYNTALRTTTITVSPNFAWWRLGKFTSAELSDASRSGPDAVYGLDGIPNLIKYALGLEPYLNSDSGLPQLSIAGSEFVYNYSRPSDRPDVSYAVQVSADLITWTASGVTHERVQILGSTETWRGRYPVDANASTFFRLSVVILP